MSAYYNEIESYPCQWLRNLIAAGEIADGTVDERSIEDVQPADIGGGQAHFFAGIGAWSYALRLAGVPDDAVLWTASLPCQPFSVAGKGKGVEDERHLWPVFSELVRKCRPSAIFGEQVSSPDAAAWLDAVFDDLERLGYACSAAVLPACSELAPHRRERLFWGAAHPLRVGELADADVTRRQGRGAVQCPDQRAPRAPGVVDRLADRDCRGLSERIPEEPGSAGKAASQSRRSGCDDVSELAYLHQHGCRRPILHLRQRHKGSPEANAGRPSAFDPWADGEFIPLRDGTLRPTERGALPLDDGTPCRVGRIRAYGNAIVPQVAARFVRNFLDSASEVFA